MTRIFTRQGQKGAAAVEFAILCGLLLVLLVGTVEFGFLWLESHYIANAAREGARVAAKTLEPTNRATIAQDTVENYLEDLFLFKDKVDDAGFLQFNYQETTLTDTDGSALVDPTTGDTIDDVELAQVTITVDTSQAWPPILWPLLEAVPFFPNHKYPDNYLSTITQSASFVIEN